MPIKDPNFSSVARAKSNPGYTLEDVHRMEDYKRNLVDYFLQKIDPDNGMEISQEQKADMLAELRRTEAWTKAKATDIINQNIIF